MTNEESTRGLSRRTVVKAAAWSVPVIAIGTPAFAQTISGPLGFDGTACKLPGNSNDIFKGYAFGLTLTNTDSNDAITVTITALELNGEDLGDVRLVRTSPTDANVCEDLGVNTVVIPAATTIDNVVALTQEAASSSNGTLEVFYTVAPSTTPITGETVVDSAPPIQGNSCSDFTRSQKTCLGGLSGLQPPTISAIVPSTGPAGTLVQIEGTNFFGLQNIVFDATPIQADTVNPDGTIIVFTVPSDATLGAKTVGIVTLGGSAQTSFEVTAS